jgi:hypothetical protein
MGVKRDSGITRRTQIVFKILRYGEYFTAESRSNKRPEETER